MMFLSHTVYDQHVSVAVATIFRVTWKNLSKCIGEPFDDKQYVMINNI